MALALAVLTAAFATGATAQEPAASGRKIALVIGNQAYTKVAPLQNALADARAMAAKLKEKGYDVTSGFDLTRELMFRKMDGFLNGIQEGDEVVIYYAGHGVELTGANYLLPTDVEPFLPDSVSLATRSAFPLADVIEILDKRRPRVGIVIVDACRNNPLRLQQLSSLTRALPSQTRGLARVEPASGTVVMYSAGIGQQALDRLNPPDSSPNGLYTRKLLKLMDEEGLELYRLSQKLANEVEVAAREVKDPDGNPHRQEPITMIKLRGEFYFTPAKPIEVAKPAPITTTCEKLVKPDASPAALRFANVDIAVKACESAVSQFSGEGHLADLLTTAQEQQAFQRAIVRNTREDGEAYLAMFPKGRFQKEVETQLAALGPAKIVVEPPAPVVTPRVEPEPAPKPAPAPVVVTPPAPVVAPPPEPVVVVPPAPDDGPGTVKFAYAAQAELNRLGCYASKPDGDWDATSRSAVTKFNSSSSSRLKVDLAAWTTDDLDALKARTERVCPMVCPGGQRASDQGCVPIACPAGKRLTASGTCQAIPRPTPIRKADIPPRPVSPIVKPKPSGGGSKKCFTFNGEKFCD